MKPSNFFPASLASFFPTRKSSLTPPTSGVKVVFVRERSCLSCHRRVLAVTLLCATGQTIAGCSAWGISHCHGCIPMAKPADTLQHCYSTGRGRQQSFHPVPSGQS